jgi:tRNA G18 (ribose-2'-O)-methylase SpoU
LRINSRMKTCQNGLHNSLKKLRQLEGLLCLRKPRPTNSALSSTAVQLYSCVINRLACDTMKSPLSTSTPPIRRSINKQDNFFQRAEVIKRNREKRTQHAQFLLEGVAQISIAAKYGWTIHSFLHAVDRPLSSWAAELVKSSVAREVWELSSELMALLSEKDETSELLAIVETRKLAPAVIKPSPTGLVVVFDRPSSPGNLGSSIRSADAFGANGIIVTGHAVDIYDPFVIRGSMGAIFGLPVTSAASHLEVKEWVENARSHGYDYQIIGSSGKTDTLITARQFTRPTVLILGNETVGMSRGYWDICDAVVKIPIGGELSSINVSCAASVLMYEISRQRMSFVNK